jgi:hypothetical protein
MKNFHDRMRRADHGPLRRQGFKDATLREEGSFSEFGDRKTGQVVALKRRTSRCSVLRWYKDHATIADGALRVHCSKTQDNYAAQGFAECSWTVGGGKSDSGPPSG